MESDIEMIYRKVADGALSKAAALALILDLKRRGGPSRPEAAQRVSLQPDSPPPGQDGPLPTVLRPRRSLADPRAQEPEFPSTVRAQKRSLTPLPALPPVASAPSPEPASGPELLDCGSGVYRICINAGDPALPTPEILAGIARCFAELKGRSDAKVILVSGGHNVFLGAVPAPAATQSGQGCTEAVRDCILPVIAAMEGDALGLGWVLGSLCDFIICSQTALYGFADALSLESARQEWGPFLRERFGAHLAAKLLRETVPLSGTELSKCGISIPVVPGSEVDSRAMELAREMARFPRESLSLLKCHLSRNLGEESRRISSTEPEAVGNGHAETSLALPADPENGSPATHIRDLANRSGEPVELSLGSDGVRLVAHPDGVLLAILSDRVTKNAFSPALTQGIQELFAHIQAHPEYKVVVLTGYDQYFASGGTKEGLLSIHNRTARYSDAPLYELPLRCDIPIIAAMQGHAIGAGWSFGMFCDQVVLAEEGIYSSRFMRYGFTPGFGSTLIFGHRFGHDLGREILFGARDYSGHDLKRRGVQMPVVPAKDVLPLALQQAHRLAASSRDSLVTAKQPATRRLVERLPAIVQAELDMHDRTFVGNAGALKGIELHFDAHGAEPGIRSNPEPTPPVVPVGNGLDRILDTLRDTLAEELRMASGEIEADAPFTDLGLDSITGVSWVRRINKRFDLSISANEVYHAPTLGEFARLVQDRITLSGGGKPNAPSELEAPRLSRAVCNPVAQNQQSGTHPAPIRYPLSEGQKGLWLLQRLDPDMAAYNVPVAFLIREAHWASVLEDTLAALLARHPVLKAVIAADEQGQPYQYLPATSLIRVQRESIASLSDEAFLTHLKTAFKKPFRLDNDALLRVQLITDPQGRQVVLITLHHILFDGTSLAIFIRDLIDIGSRAARHATLDAAGPVAPAFFDFLRWEQAFLQGGDGEKELAYWREQLSGEMAVSEFPVDRARPARRTYAGATVSSRLPAPLSERLRDLAKQRQVSLFTLLLAIYKVLLSRYTRQETIVVGVPVARRPDERFKEAIGYFVNMVAIKSAPGADVTFAAYLEQVKWTVLNALEHSSYPFARLVSELRIEPSPLHSPVFQTVFVLQNFLPHGGFLESAQPDIGVEMLPGLHQEGEYDLRFEMVDVGQQMELSVSYDSDVLNQETMERFIQHYGSLAEAIADDPEERLSRYTILSEAERHRVEQTWNQPRKASTQDGCVQDVFAQQAGRHPEAIAMISEGGSWTFREVHERVSTLAACLQSRGVGPEDRVALCLQRSPDMVISVLGVLRAGAAYVPIDPAYPADRIAFLLADSGARLVLTDGPSTAHLYEANRSAVPVIRIDRDWERIQADGARRILARDVTPSNLAYVIYTSGSTGMPKGVMVEHRQILNTLRHFQVAYPVGETDTYLLKTNYTFDVSLAELFGWFIGSGRLAVLPAGDERFPDRIANAIHSWGVTHVNFVPSALGVFLHAIKGAPPSPKLACLKYVMVAGEAFPKEMVADAVRAFPGARVENIYGPTETAIYACAYSCGPQAIGSANTPIGKPIANTQLYVLDRWRRSAGIGVPGELGIAGEGVARGYLNRPELTAENFVDNPFEPGTRLFLTGDLVRWLPDGQIEYFGRIDQQLKIRGFRVEPGEIEGVLNQHQGIQASVVVAIEDGASRQLVAFYVPKPGCEEIGAQALINHLGSRLPDYMVPSFYVPLDAIPLTSSGKVNRHALSTREFRRDSKGAKIAPQGAIEERIAAIWKDLLKLEMVSTTDRFFEVGGNSLLAVMLADRISRQFTCSFPAAALFKHPTIQAIARQVAPPEAAGATPQASAQPFRDLPAMPQEDYPPYYDDSLAIIGMSCCFPGANDLDQFWSMLCEGRSGGRFLTKEELRQRGVPEALIHDPKFVPLSLAIEEKDVFDADFFNIPARNAYLMDPQFRQLLSHAWRAVEDAGYAPGKIPETSVFMSAGNSFYQRALDRSGLVEPSDAYTSWVLAQGGTIPAMVSYALGLTGPSLFVHTNCSSSLAGLHLACQSLRAGESKYALVGGATLFCPSRDGYLHRPGLNFSSDGRCKTFDAAADGMIGGEGVAVVLLKRAREALADGDAIYALIRGVAMNNDGPEKAGFYSPGVRGQAAVIDAVLRSTQVDPESISYIEAHGTGTHLGDPVEVMALTDAYRRHTTRTRFCGLGSVKSNIGHADTAAGLAGCIKVALSLHHRTVVPSINYQTPNPAIDFAASPFYVADKLMPWPQSDTPRRAALSSFGIGGSNLHAILEECIEPLHEPARLEGGVPQRLSDRPRPRPSSLVLEEENEKSRTKVEDEGRGRPGFMVPGWEVAGPFLVPLSARNRERLREMMANLHRFLDTHDSVAIADVAYTLSVGREQMDSRAAFLAEDLADLLLKLKHACTQDNNGDGFWLGSASDKEGDDILSPDDAQAMAAKWKIEGRLDKLARLWVRGFALDWTGLFDTQRCRRVHLPSYPFAKDRYAIDPIEPDTQPANPSPPRGHPLLHENASTLRELAFATVLSGREFFLSHHLVQGRKLLPAVVFLEMVHAAAAKMAGNQPPGGMRLRDVVWLRPFHVDEEARTLRTRLLPMAPDRVEIEISAEADGNERVAHCRGAVLLSSAQPPAPLDIAELRRGFTDRRWTGTECYQAFADAGFQYGASFQAISEVSLGNGQALARLVLPAILAGTQAAYTLHPSLMDAALQACAILSLETSLAGSGGSSPAPARGLPFALQSVDIFRPCPATAWAWIRAVGGSRPDERLRKFDIDVCDDQGQVCVQLRGYSSLAVEQPVLAPDSPATLHYRQVWQSKPAVPEMPLPDDGQRIVWTCGVTPLNMQMPVCLHLAGPGNRENLGPWFVDVAGRIFQGVQDTLQKRPNSNVLIQLVIPSQGPESCLGAIAGLFRTAHLENPRLLGQIVEITPGTKPGDVAEKLALDGRCPGDFLVRHTDHERSVPAWVEVEVDEVHPQRPWKDHGVYIITGGAGGLGRMFAHEIVTHARLAKVILVGRSTVSAAELEGWDLPPDRVSYHSVDLSRAEEVVAFMRRIKATHPVIDGILHGAGIIRDNFILKKSLDEFKAVLAPKVLGTVHLDQAAREFKPAFIALFSSGVAWFGSPGQADYATANAFMDRFACLRQGDCDHPRIVSIDWPLWKEGGMRADDGRLSALQKAGMAPLEAAQGVAAFNAALALASGQAQWMVLAGHGDRLRALMASAARPAILKPQPLQRAIDGPDLDARITEYVRRIISEATKRPLEKVARDTPFEKYGIDSILQITIIEELQKATGELAKTLLFEYPTLGELVDYLMREHSEALRRHLGGAVEQAASVPNPESSPASPAVPMAAPRSSDSGNDALRSGDIAIIGISGRYPMSSSLEEFWDHLKAGRNCITKADSRRWPQSTLFASKNGSSEHQTEFHGGFLREVDRFDHSLFGVPPEQVMKLSPETRMFLEVAWETFEDAGYARPALRQIQGHSPGGIGVLVGVMYNQYPWTFPSAEQAALGSNATEWHIANRISHFFDLTGPSMAVNSACSSSLLAIHLACESLKQGTCSMALAGGVNLTLHLSKFGFLQATNLLDKGLASRSFGAGEGYIPGEGVGAVLLKPLREALQDGDQIHGVIKASFANHAGGRQIYTAPDPNQQARLIAECIKRSGIDPDTIGYVESAVNGSPLGDPIEVLALKKAFKQFTAREGYCALGSVKSNLGHLEAASGISQLSKVLLQMKHRLLVPSIHSRPRNPAIRLEGSPFYIPEESRSWPVIVDPDTGNELPRRSLINSIGAGGTCVSILVEEYPSKPSIGSPDTAGAPAQLIVLSAATKTSLLASAQRLSAHLQQNPSLGLREVAHALFRREQLPGCRAALIADSLPEAIRKLDQLATLAAGDDSLNIYLSSERGSDKNPTSMTFDGNSLPALAAHWVAGGGLQYAPVDEAGGPIFPALPKYAFDHSRSFAWGDSPSDAEARSSNESVAEKIGRVVYIHDEPFLRDHTLGGKQILIGVTHASLAVDAHFRRFPADQAVCLRQLTFIKPIEVGPSEQAEVEVHEDSHSDPTSFKVRFRMSAGAAWQDTASGRLQRSDPKFGRQDLEALKAACAPVADLRSIYDAGEPFFKVGASFRTIRQLLCGPGVALAEIDLTEAIKSQPRDYHLHPLLTYSAFSALIPLLGPAGFSHAFLPFGIKNLEFRKGYDLKNAWVVVRLVKNTGEMVFFDADVLTPHGDEIAFYRDCSIKRLRRDAARPSSPALALRTPTPPAAEEDGTSAVRKYLLKTLGLPPDATDLDTNLMELGLASAQLVDLVGRISSDTGIPLDPTLFFEYPTIRDLTGFFVENHPARFLNQVKPSTKPAQPPDSPGVDLPDDACPLSEGQKGLWALQKTSPAMTAYNCPLCFQVSEPLDIRYFQDAYRFLLKQHPLLASRIEEKNGTPVFVPGPANALELPQVNARGWSDSKVLAWVKKAVKVPFDLEKDGLIRATLLLRSDRETVVLFTVHHIVFDGSSFALLMKSLLDAYRLIRMGRQPELASSAASYRDYVMAERSRLDSREGANRLAFWKDQLSGERPPLELPLDYPRSLSRPFAGQTASTQVSPELAGRLRAFGKEHALYASSIFLALFKELLRLYSGQTDLIVGMPVNERADGRFLSIIGYFVNMIPIRSRRIGEQPFVTFAQAVQQAMLAALANRYPFPALVRELKMSGQGDHPVFQAAFEYQNFLRAGDADAVQKAVANAFPMTWFEDMHQEGEYELALEVIEQAEGFQLNLKFNPTLLREATAARMVSQLTMLLESALAQPQRVPAADLLLSQAERHTLLERWNDTRCDYPRDACIHHFFERQARRTPKSIAVIFKEEALSYKDLDDRSTRLALHLQRLGVQPDALVGLCLDRSLEMIIAILGVLKAGGAYLPLDPDYPEERLAFMVGDSKTSWILSQSHLAGKVSKIKSSATQVLFLDRDWKKIVSGAKGKLKLKREVQARNLAYVLYTSGSTGTPKGVMVEHRALCNRIVWMQRAYPLDQADRVLQKTPFSFDVSGWELHWPLMAGAKLIFAAPGKHKDPEYLCDIIQAHAITVLHFVSSMLQAFLALDRASQCRSLRHVFCSGEELTPAQVRRFFERFEKPLLHNLYGPTEAAIDVSCKQCEPGATQVTIGKPIANVQLHVVDSQLRLLPIGFPGELCIAGDALARGYLNRPDLTADRFVENPFAPGAKLYRTGDLARWTPDGEIEFLGRLDHQVKIRGCRIELGEIESAMTGLEGIREAVVVPQQDGDNKKLVAFYVAPASPVNHQSLRQQLKRHLPEHMIPSAFVLLDRIPLTSSGKVDRRTLSQQRAPVKAKEANGRPQTQTQARLMALWCEALSLQTVGIHESFFDLGGHSLSALSLTAKINAAFGTRLPLAILFEAKCIADLALRMEANDAPEPSPYLTALEPHGSRPPLFLVPGIGGSGLSLLPLSRAMGPDQPVFLFQSPGLQGEREPLTTIQELAEFYIDRLPRQPGPAGYCLGGWSMGGVVAYEMACQLARRRIPVDRLILVDSYLPEHFERFSRIAGKVAVSQSVSGAPLPPELEPGDSISARHVADVLAAHQRALANYRATQVYPGEVLYFYATENTRLASRRSGRTRTQPAPARLMKETRAVWQKYLPQIAGRFVTVRGSHDSILQEPAVRRIAREILSFCSHAVAIPAAPMPARMPNSAL